MLMFNKKKYPIIKQVQKTDLKHEFVFGLEHSIIFEYVLLIVIFLII